MIINVEITGSSLDGLSHVVESYNEENSGSLEFQPVTTEDYFRRRCDDLLEKYSKSYQSYLESKDSNLDLYKSVIENKDNPAVKSALANLISTVNSVK